jgi:signal peptidase I
LDQFTTQISPQPEEPEVKKKPSRTNFWLDTLETILMALLLFLAINAVTSRVRVENISMEPTLQPGYLLIVNKLAYKLGEPQHGDIVVFHYMGDKNEDYIKRVIGLPGDEVKIKNGTVYVNGTALNEPYIMAFPTYSGTWVVPEESLFVLGDNRNNSSDSHQWGFVDMDDVVGKAVFIYYPFDVIGSLVIPDLVQAAH